MSLALKLEEKYSYGDYSAWPEEERWELIEGVPFAMSPAPTREHQKLFRKIFVPIANYLENKSCEVYGAPFDVRLPEKNERDEEVVTVVQPDILVVCDEKKLDKKGCRGAPDLIIEIISPGTAYKDAQIKLNLYEKHGVKEYWMVYPEEKIIMVFSLNSENKYGKPETYSIENTLKTNILPGFELNLATVFA